MLMASYEGSQKSRHQKGDYCPLCAKSGRYDSAVIKPPTPKDLLKWGQQNRYITQVVTLYHQDVVDCVFSREVISRIVLIIMAVAVLSSSLMAKPQAMYNGQDTTSINGHQHDSDEPLNEHDPLLFHSHGNVHHLNADHSHDLNKLFTLTALQAGMQVCARRLR